MLKYLFIIFSLPLILVFIWFKDGYLLGIAEGALPFYKLERYLEPTKYAWMEHPGLGNISLLTTAAKPTYIFLTFLQNNLNIPGFIIQAGVFYFILVSAGVGVYLLTKEFFPKLDDKYVILSVFFYWFNPLAITIWNRFLLNYIFFFGAIPLLLYLFIKGLATKKYYYALTLTLLIGVYVFAISALAFVLLIWISFLLFTFFFFITVKDSASRWFFVKFVSLTLILFIFTNSWWLGQLFSLPLQMGFAPTISNFSTSDNVVTLDMLSKKLGDLTNVIRLINASSPEIIGVDWINFFYSPIVVLFEFIIIGLILITIIKNRREKSILILGGLFFVTVFLAKGINPPLGEIYRLFFKTFSFLHDRYSFKFKP